jgi:excisionase family DNA binding protein
MSGPGIELDWRLSDVCDFLSVTRQTVHRWMKREVNPMPFYRPGGSTLRFSSREVIEWATTHTSED